MRNSAISSILFLFMIVFSPSCSAESQETAISLNNQGVIALHKGKWRIAFDKLEAALKLDPGCHDARINLAIAHNNWALQLLRRQHKFAEALQEFHRAEYLAEQPVIVANMRRVIHSIGKDPDKYNDRVELGDQARSSNDLVGTVVEYRAALKLKNNPRIHRKLGNVYRLLDEPDKAIAEYAAADRAEE